jgi:hypothetical protein
MASNPKAEEMKRKMEAMRAQALAAFPFEIVKVPGGTALKEWEALKRAGRGFPVVVGDDEALSRITEPFSDHWHDKRNVAEVLATADTLKHPESLKAHRQSDRARSLEFLKKSFDAKQFGGRTFEEMAAELDVGPEIGEWPAAPETAPGALTVVTDFRTGGFIETAHIVLIPTDDWTTVPAHLRWGGWNSCPPSEYHVAALRSWRDRYGVELVGMNFDTLNLRADRSPRTRDVALALAREQYDYCNDIVDQGAGTLSAYAASLMALRWWYFWWD